MHGGIKLVFDGATADQETVLDMGPATMLAVWHMISNQPETPQGGHVELQLCTGPDGADAIPYPATGTTNFCLGVPAGNQTASYVAIYKGLPRWIKLKLLVADSTHRVVVQAFD